MVEDPKPEEVKKAAIPEILKFTVALDDSALETCKVTVSSKQSSCGGLSSFVGIVNPSFKIDLPPVTLGISPFSCQITEIETICSLLASGNPKTCIDVTNPKLPTDKNSYFFKIQKTGTSGCNLVPDYDSSN